eukprot:scaffold4825_cov132-Cylindrotheca_fusiformis.AAC.1
MALQKSEKASAEFNTTTFIKKELCPYSTGSAKVGEVGTEKWGVDTVDSCKDSRTRIAPHDTHDDVSSLAREERELSNGHAGGDAVTVAHFSCGPTTVTDSFS